MGDWINPIEKDKTYSHAAGRIMPSTRRQVSQTWAFGRSLYTSTLGPQTMSFIGDVKRPKVTYDKGQQVTGLWEQYKRIDGEKTDEVSHLSGKVYTDKEGNEQTFSIQTGDVFKVWPNGYKDQQGDNAPSYILRIYKPDGTVQEVPVEEESVKEESGE